MPYIQLTTISETEKAWQLPNGSWIPKSILDNRGLNAPFYKLKDWWLEKTFEKAKYDDCKTSQKVLSGLQEITIEFRDIPEEVRKNWNKYWSNQSTDYRLYDMEPRLWGNDCFEGEMGSPF